MLQLPLLPLEAGPVEQAMGVERVPDAQPVAEREADRGAALAQHRARLGELLRRRAVLAREVLDRVLAFCRHRRIELEGLEAQLDRKAAVEPLERLLKRPEAHGTPRAGDV